MKAQHLIIKGQVQNVGFRDWMVALASRNGLCGWVRNLPDGAVEALLAGETEAIEEVLRACRRGPPLAVVDSITETLAEPPDEDGFFKKI